MRKITMPAKVWFDQGTEFSGVYRKFCTDRKIKIYSTRNETEADVVERAIKTLKNLIYRYMEENADKDIRKWIPFSKLFTQEKIAHQIRLQKCN